MRVTSLIDCTTILQVPSHLNCKLIKNKNETGIVFKTKVRWQTSDKTGMKLLINDLKKYNILIIALVISLFI